MSATVYDFVPSEPDDAPEMVMPTDGALTCEECGTLFEHSGRGRKPKRCPDCRTKKSSSAPRNRAPSGDVRAAMAVLDGMYNALSLGLMMTSPRAASTWASQVDGLRETSQLSLQSDPTLAKQISRIGTVTGRGMFFGAHLMALAPVVMVLREDMSERRAAKRASQPQPEPEETPQSTQRYPNQELFE